MFLSDEVRAEATPAAAATRLATLVRGTALTGASQAACGYPRLTRVQCRGPVRQGATAVLILRWEAADDSGRAFPVLDADITVIPDGEHAVLIGLAGVYRTPPGARQAPAAALTAAAVIRTLLTGIADAVSDQAAAGKIAGGSRQLLA